MLIKKVATSLTAFDVFLSLRSQRHAFILDSAMRHERLGRYSFVGAEPFLTFSSKGDVCRIIRSGEQEQIIKADPLVTLQDLLGQYRFSSDGEVPFGGGAVGYFGYDLKRFLEKLPETTEDDVEIADCFFGFYECVYVFDHILETVSLAALGINRPAVVMLAEMEKHLLRVAEQPPVCPEFGGDSESFSVNMSKKEYLRSINRVKEYIRAGDIYQANFTQRFECGFTGNPAAFYAALRHANPAPFAAYIDTGECCVISSSPERFLRVQDGRVETRPIKGTIARGRTPAEDEQNRRFLLQSEKDRAELLMIVDLERNDLSKIALPGTVEVPELFVIESYATVHHLVATVSARLRPDCDLIDCIRAAFPGGSITGAPKIRAMEIIDELEPTARNIYTGAIGYLGFDGNMDTNIVIRTVVVKNGRAFFQAGGGIVWDSDPQQEYEESLIKASALMKTLQATGGRSENLG